MRKPLIALGLIACASLGATPAAKALAAPPLSKNLNSNSSSTHFSSNLTRGKGRAVSGAAIVQTAMKYLGYPYTATGNSPNTGFSCIGFVSFVYRSNGIPLPGDLGSALAYAPRVPFSNLSPGDILYFQNTVWKGLSHAAIYIGGGKFIHAEYYNRGVVISSFRNDPVDGSTYWISKYLGANRPWNGAASVPSIPGASPGGSGTPASKSVTNVGAGPSGVVINATGGLRVHSSPSRSASLVTVAPNGSSVTVVGQKSGWYQVQLPNGTTGWVVAKYIRVAKATTGTTSVNGTTNTTATTPTRAGFPGRGSSTSRGTRTHAAVNVRSGPSLRSAIVTVVPSGGSMHIMSWSNGWAHVRLNSGITGWVSGTVLGGAKSTSIAYQSRSFRRTNRRASVRSSTQGHSVLTAGVRVHASPGMKSQVIGLAGAGTHVRVIGYSRGWALVRLPSGQSGYVLGSYVR